MNWSIIFNILSIATTLIGFFVTYKMTMKNLIAETEKIKMTAGLNKMIDMPLKIDKFMSEVIAQRIDKDEFEEIATVSYSYGSKKTVQIIVELQRMANNNSAGQTIEWITLFSVLISQIKYDLIGEVVSPEGWFEFKMVDYQTTIKPIVQKAIRKYVKQFNLNKGFLV